MKALITASPKTIVYGELYIPDYLNEDDILEYIEANWDKATFNEPKMEDLKKADFEYEISTSAHDAWNGRD